MDQDFWIGIGISAVALGFFVIVAICVGQAPAYLAQNLKDNARGIRRVARGESFFEPETQLESEPVLPVNKRKLGSALLQFGIIAAIIAAVFIAAEIFTQ